MSNPLYEQTSQAMKKPNSPARIACAAFIFLCFSVAGCATKGAQNSQNSATNLFKQDGYEKLLERQRASMPPELETNKKLAKITEADRERLGDNYLQQGKPEMAFLQYNKVLQKKPDDLNVLYKRGMVFLTRGLNEDAMNDFRAVLSKDPSHALAQQGMGLVFYKMKNYPEARQHFQQALKSNPRLWVSHNFLGLMYDYEQQSGSAVEQYQAAIAINPDDASLYNNLGVSYSLNGEYDKAVETFARGLKINPKDGKMGNNLGMVLCKLGRPMEALGAFKIAGDEAQAYNNLGCFYLQEGEYEKAVRAFEKAVELRSNYYAQATENLKKAEIALNAGASPGHPKVRQSEAVPAYRAPVVSPKSTSMPIKETPILDDKQESAKPSVDANRPDQIP
jgi:Tfp pilus assembly protein PilF